MKKLRFVDSNHRLAPLMPFILIAGGSIGLICSAILSYEAMRLLKNPAFTPPCNLNPVISCGSVLHSTIGEVFGFPNSWVGMAGFAILLTVGLSLLAGAKFKSWFWLCFAAGIDLGVIFAYWMLWQSVYRIKALCPFCLIVDVDITVVFWYSSLYLTREGHLPMPRRLIGLADFARRYHLEIIITWVLIITALILQHFWYYYGKHI
jgi:uncharacterized membrane protein